MLNKFRDICFCYSRSIRCDYFLRMFYLIERIARKKATIPFNSWNALLREWRTTKLHPHDTKMNIVYLSKAFLKCFLNLKRRNKKKKIILKSFAKEHIRCEMVKMLVSTLFTINTFWIWRKREHERKTNYVFYK